MAAVGAVGLPGGGAEPHLPVEGGGAGLGGDVDLAGPEELPVEALAGADDAADGLAGGGDEAVLDGLADGLDGGAEAVEGVLEAEPGVEAEHPAFGLDVFHDAAALADGAGHGLLAPDVLAGAGGHDALDGVPVGRGADVDDVDVGVLEELDEVLVGLDLAPAGLLGAGEAVFDAGLVGVAEADEARALEAEVVAAVGDAAEADEGARDLVGGGGLAAQDVGGDDVEEADRGGGLEEVSAGGVHGAPLVVTWSDAGRRGRCLGRGGRRPRVR